MYYTDEEMLTALQRATDTINQLTNACKEYTRGVNDCFALFAEYDLELRGKSKARDLFTTRWKSSREWLHQLLKSGHTLRTYAEYCGYEYIPSRRPKLGDIAFEKGSAMIAGDGFWHLTREDNLGVRENRQILFLERHLELARPRK